MARSDNSVSIGSFVDPLAGLQKATAQLGDIYAGQINRQDALARQAEETRRWDIANQRAEEKLAQEKAAQQSLVDVMTNYSPADAREAAFNANPELKAAFDTQIGKSREALAKSILSKYTRNQMGAQGEEWGVNRGLTDAYIPENAYESLMKAREANPDSPMLKEFDAANAQLTQDTKNYIRSNNPLYFQQEKAAIFKDLVSRGVSPTIADATSTNLAGQYDKKDVLTKAAVEARKEADRRAENAAELGFKAYKEYHDQKAKNGFKVPTGSLDKTEAFNEISNKIDPGIYDTNKLYGQWQAAVESGIDPKSAMYALKNAIDIGYFGNKSPTYGSPSEFVTFAKGFLANAGKTAGAPDMSVDDIVKRFSPVYTKTTDPIAENREAFIGGLRSRLPTMDSLAGTMLPKKLPSGLDGYPDFNENIAAMAGKPNIDTLNVNKTNKPVVDSTGPIRTLPPKEIRDDAKATLKESMGSKFDLGSDTASYSGRTKKQRISNDLLAAQIVLDKLEKQSNANPFVGVSPLFAAQHQRSRELLLQDARNDVNRLKDLLNSTK